MKWRAMKCTKLKFTTLVSMGLFFTGLWFGFENSVLAKTPTRERIESEFSKRHPQDSSQNISDFWKTLPQDAPQVLLEMLSEGPGPLYRARILEGLGHFQSEEISGALKKEIEQTKNSIFKKKALGALVHSEGARALEFVEPYLKSEDPHLRKEVAKSLQLFALNGEKSEAVQNRLSEFVRNEKLEWVKDLHDPAWEGSFEGFVLDGKTSKKGTVQLIWKKKEWSAILQGVQLKPSQKIQIRFFKVNELNWVEITAAGQSWVFLASRK